MLINVDEDKEKFGTLITFLLFLFPEDFKRRQKVLTQKESVKKCSP